MKRYPCYGLKDLILIGLLMQIDPQICATSIKIPMTC